MIDWIRDTLQWFETHPAVIAWLVGWLAGVSAGELAKRLLPVSMESTTVVRWSQAAAVVVGAAIAFLIWPRVGPNRFAFAICVGMSATLAYEWGKAVVARFWPDVAQRASVTTIIEARRDKLERAKRAAMGDSSDDAGA